MNPMEMAHWPGTPGPERLRRAGEIISEDAQRPVSRLDDEDAGLDDAEQDARTLTWMVEQLEFTGWAHEELGRLNLAEQINHPLDLADLALRGTDPRFIGMLIQLGEGTEDRKYIITRLFRHPEWVGLNRLLPKLGGLEVHVFGGQGNGYTPMLVVGSPRWTNRDESNPVEARGDLVEAIREVTAWHGATDCCWHGPELG